MLASLLVGLVWRSCEAAVRPSNTWADRERVCFRRAHRLVAAPEVEQHADDLCADTRAVCQSSPQCVPLIEVLHTDENELAEGECQEAPVSVGRRHAEGHRQKQRERGRHTVLARARVSHHGRPTAAARHARPLGGAGRCRARLEADAPMVAFSDRLSGGLSVSNFHEDVCGEPCGRRHRYMRSCVASLSLI
jgi:hypothetical protein